MTRTVFMVEHHDGLGLDHTPDPWLHDGKHIGAYTTEDRAMQALRRVADQPGFRDWPGGFRLYGGPPDVGHWLEGYAPYD